MKRPGLAVLFAVCAGVIAVAELRAASTVADAAQRGDLATVQALVKQGADVNAAQGDGMTALHWAALNGDMKIADVLLNAGAMPEATTRIGKYTPLHLASSRGHAALVSRLLAAGTNAKAETDTGVQPIHLAAQAGSADAIRALIERGADVNVRDETHGRTPLIFAASEDRVDAMKLLIAKGADIRATTRVIDYVQRSTADNAARTARDRNVAAISGRATTGRAAAAFDPNDPDTTQGARAGGRGAGGNPNGPRAMSDIETIGRQGGFTALHYAVRDGFADVASLLLDAGMDPNARTEGDRSSPMLVAVINGQYDLAMLLLSRGGNPNLANDDGTAPLFSTLNNEWALRTWYPQPTAGTQQKTSYLQLLEAMLKAGADPDARTKSHIWYASYNTGRMGVDFTGATPFWRAAYALDIDAMRLLVKYGADPTIPTMSFGVQSRATDQSGLPPVPAGGPHVPPFHAASGVGYGTSRVAQQHRHVPDGWMAAAKYFVEELGVDVNVRDADGFTALHHAAARGDNDVILYLVKHGANVMAVARSGQTTVDMANSPEQRTQPFPETIKLLEGMGAKNNHKCQACK